MKSFFWRHCRGYQIRARYNCGCWINRIDHRVAGWYGRCYVT